MKYINKSISQVSSPIQWRMTDDGFLRCTARVQQEKILQYKLHELLEIPDGFLKDEVSVFVPRSVLTDTLSMKSLEGAPVVAWDHVWADPTVIKDVSVGSVAGAPMMDDSFLVCDLLITDSKTIEQIKNGKIGEISAAYYADTIFEPGQFHGEAFDARQDALRYNHIAVIPVGEGRAGVNVRIINKLTAGEDPTMSDTPKMVRVKARNCKRYMNIEEDSVEVHTQEVEDMDEKLAVAAKNMEQMESELDQHKENAEAPCTRCQELEGELAVYKQQVESMGSDEEQIEAAALNMMEETREAGEILENTELVDEEGTPMNEKNTKEFMNAIPLIHGDVLRRKVLSAVGIKIGNMSSDVLKGAWIARKQIINMRSGTVAGGRMLNKHMDNIVTHTSRSPRDRLGIT